MRKLRLVPIVLFAVIAGLSSCLSAATAVWRDTQPEQAAPFIGPHSQLPQNLDAVSLRGSAKSIGSPVGQTLLLGTTWYDYQHNGTIGKMVALTPSRGVHFCWMNGFEATAVHRHIFYNYWNGSVGSLAWPGTGYQVDQGDRAGYTTLSQFNSGEAVVAYQSRPAADSTFRTQVAWDFLEGFGAFQLTDLVNPPGWDWLEWPKVAVCSQDYIHVVCCEARATQWMRIAYARSQDGGQTYTTFAAVDTLLTISQDVAASPVSNKVGIAYCKSEFDPLNLGPYSGLLVSQMNNGITLVESSDGTTWDFSTRRDITNLVNPDTSRYPDVTYANGDTLRAYCDVSLLYDQSDAAHVAFTTRGLWFDALLYARGSYAVEDYTQDASMIWHWNEDLDTLTVVADGWYNVDPHPGGSKYRGPGAWRSTVDRPSLGQDPNTGYLYCLYVKCPQADTSGGPDPSHGWANGEIYCSVSTNGGLNWSVGVNLTNTPCPNCTPGNCFDEDYPSLAAVVNDTLHIIYIEDKDAGGVVQSDLQEGIWTENPVKYLKVPASLVPPGPPYVPNFNFHVGPEESVPVVLSSFEAISGVGFIAIEWVTASEVDCHRWEIYRSDSEDGNYVKMAELSGHGCTESEHAYQWVDQQVSPGVSYFYKLREVDFDGSQWWSQVVSATPGSSVPQTYALHQNHPNPFNAATEIRYQIPKDGHVALRIFNTLGQCVRTLVDARQAAGIYSVTWNGRDADGHDVASGLYFVRMEVGGFGKTVKMVLLR